MHVTDRSKTVVMLIDWDNLQICHSRDAPGTDLDLQALIALAQSYGTLVSARAYAEWNLLSERLAVYKAGIEPVFAPVMRPEGSPREGKSLADTVMVADGVDLLWTVAPDVFVLATSDKDMIPLARIAKQRGAAVVVLGSDLTAIPLVEMSNVFITYRQLLRELDRVSELEAPVGRAPARERRLRESRRPSSEPYGGGLGMVGARRRPDRRRVGRGGRGGRSARRSASPAPAAPSQVAAGHERAAPTAGARSVSARTEPALADAAVRRHSRCDRTGSDSRRRAGGDRRRRRRASATTTARRTRSTYRSRRASATPTCRPRRCRDAIDETRRAPRTTTSRSQPAPARASSPDDIDNAVLQLLASRDREARRCTVSDERHGGGEPLRRRSEPTRTAPAERVDADPRRRVVRTSFSSFGPPEAAIRPDHLGDAGIVEHRLPSVERARAAPVELG